jgi:hypothetical protein
VCSPWFVDRRGFFLCRSLAVLLVLSYVYRVKAWFLCSFNMSFSCFLYMVYKPYLQLASSFSALEDVKR